MPELPEVETMVRGLRPHVAGWTLAAVRKCRCACRPLDVTPDLPRMSRRSRGQVVEEVSRLGKRVVMTLANGDAFVIEPRMTGLMLVSDPPSREHLRVCWRFERGGESGEVWFWDRRGLGTVRLYSPEELARLRDESLGPDALAMSVTDWRTALARTARPIKVALLEQRLVAGIGNLYASEILHRAGIPPTRPARELSESDARRLHEATRYVLSEAILHEGSTLGDGTYRNALNQDGRYQNEHRVYMRAGETCSTCRSGTIERIVQAQRSTFYCPVCQGEVH
jgi:formamidopyrimidine-DNA glycosylase